ncbi:MAG: hypothetical protein ACLUJR_11935 [Mediterraneibacter gnavus]
MAEQMMYGSVLWGIIRVYDKYQNCLKPLCKGKDMILPLPPCPGKPI